MREPHREEESRKPYHGRGVYNYRHRAEIGVSLPRWNCWGGELFLPQLRTEPFGHLHFR